MLEAVERVECPVELKVKPLLCLLFFAF